MFGNPKISTFHQNRKKWYRSVIRIQGGSFVFVCHCEWVTKLYISKSCSWKEKNVGQDYMYSRAKGAGRAQSAVGIQTIFVKRCTIICLFFLQVALWFCFCVQVAVFRLLCFGRCVSVACALKSPRAPLWRFIV